MMDKTLPKPEDYALDAQVGFLLRRASQRHLAIFAGGIPEVTSTQFATLAKLFELGPTSQNALGRATAMDAATIKGVTDRLRAKGLVETTRDPDDRRRLYVELTDQGRSLFTAISPAAAAISAETLSPLSEEEQRQFLSLLARLT